MIMAKTLRTCQQCYEQFMADTKRMELCPECKLANKKEAIINNQVRSNNVYSSKNPYIAWSFADLRIEFNRLSQVNQDLVVMTMGVDWMARRVRYEEALRVMRKNRDYVKNADVMAKIEYAWMLKERKNNR